MPARSLKELAQETCIRNIRDIVDIGDYPYALLRPILLKIQNPDQLRRLEENSPQICENETEANDAEIWMNFIKCDIPQWEKKFASMESPTLGWHLYQQLRLEDKLQMERDSEELKAKLRGIKDERAKHTSRILDPSEIPRTAAQRRKAASTTTRNPSTSTLTFASGSRTKTTSGASVLRKVAREAKEIQLFGARASLSTPSHKLNAKISQVTTAPRSIAQSYQNKPPIVVNQTNGILSQAELERRKQAKTAKAGSSKTNMVELSPSQTAKSPTSGGVKRNSSGDPKYGMPSRSLDVPREAEPPQRPIKVSRTTNNFFKSLNSGAHSSQIISPKTKIKTITSLPSEESTDLEAPLSPTASLFSPPPSPSHPLKSGDVSPRGRAPRVSPTVRSKSSVSPVKKIRRVQQTDPMMRRPANAARRRMGA